MAIVAVTGWDSAWHAESAALLDWLCGGAAPRGAFAVVAPAKAAVLAPAARRSKPRASSDAGECGSGGGGAGAQHAPNGSGGSAAATPAAVDTLADGLAAACTVSAGAKEQQQGGKEEDEDQDEKVLEFYRLVFGSSSGGDGGAESSSVGGAAAARPQRARRRRPRLAIPLGWEVAGGALRPVDGAGALARWPLAQAVEELAGAPITECCEVFDVTAATRALMGRADARAVRALLSQRLPPLRRAWGESVAVVTKKSPVARGVELSEEQLVAPLMAHAQSARAAARGASPWALAPLLAPPRALFGARTAGCGGGGGSGSGSSGGGGFGGGSGSGGGALVSSSATMREHLLEQGRPVLHATLEAADGGSCLRLARTLFFTSGLPPQLPGGGGGAGAGAGAGGGSAADSSSSNGPSSSAAGAPGAAAAAAAASASEESDGAILIKWYAAASEAAHEAMRHFACSPGASAASARAAAAAALSEAARARGLRLDGVEMRFGLWAWDAEAGAPAAAPPRPGDGRLKTLRVTAAGLRGSGGGGSGGSGSGGGGASLGAVVYADTFIDVPAAAGGEGGGGGGSGSGSGEGAGPGLINLTESIGAGVAAFESHGLEAASSVLQVRAWQRALQAPPPAPALPPAAPQSSAG